MSGEIQDVITKLAAIQATVTAPTDEKPLAVAHVDAPALVTEFPCFYNLEEGIPEIKRASGVRRMTGVIGMHLLFGRSSEQKYSVRSRRKWMKPVLDAFDAALVLGLTQDGVQYSPITNITFEPLELNQNEYVTMTFWVQVTWVETPTFGA